MLPLNSPQNRAGAVGILTGVTVVLDLLVAWIVSAHYGSSFGWAYAHALIASAGILCTLYHWSHTLAYFAILIAYQVDQNGSSSKDLAAYAGGVLVIASTMAVVNFIWYYENRLPKFKTVDDVYHRT